MRTWPCVARSPVFPIVEGRAFLFLVVLFLLPGALAAQQPPAIAGRVLDARGAPVEGAAVELIEPGITSWTDALGAFRLRLPATGEFTLRVSRIGWITLVQRVQARPGLELRIDVTLREQPVTLPALTVAAAAAQPLRIERAELERSAAGSAGDALARLPGVVISSPNPGGEQLISVRGSAHDQVLVLVDGVAINDPVTGAADLSRIPAAIIENMTLLVGAQSAQYGARALAGALVIETRQVGAAPALNLTAGSLGLLQGAGIAGGSAPLTWSVGANLQESSGQFAFVMPAELGGAREQRRNADARAIDVFGSATSRIATGALRMRVAWQTEERGLPGRSYAPALAARQEARGARAGLSWDLERMSHSLRLSAGWAGQHIVYRDSQPPVGLPYNDSVDVSTLEGRLQWERRLLRSSLGLGLDARTQRINTSTLARGFRQPAQLGVFAQGARQARLFGINALLNAQLRADHDRTQAQQFLSHSVSLSAGNNKLTGHLAQRTGYAPPALGDQFFRESAGVRPNPELRAERAQELEAGLRSEAHVGEFDVSSGVSVFTGRIRDLIVWAPDYRFIWSPQNHAALRSGVELSASATLGTTWRTDASFTISRITYDRPGKSDDAVQIVYRPRHSGAFNLERLGRHLDVRLEANYHGPRNTVPEAVNVLPSYWTSAAAVHARFALWRVPAALQLRVDRLLNEDGALIFGFPHPGRTFTTSLRLGGSAYNPRTSEHIP